MMPATRYGREGLITMLGTEGMIRTNDEAVIYYGDTDDMMVGRVVRVLRTRSGTLRRVGITPEGTDVVAWFSPAPGFEGLVSVGGATVAYL